MKDSFNGWNEISHLPIQDVANYILTGQSVEDFKPDEWLYKHIGDQNASLSVLDFGCGMGRNTYGMGLYSPKWNVVGYDNPGMIELTKSYYLMKYGTSNVPSNISFCNNWEILKNKKFDCIFCCIVLQHIREDVLTSYISDFKKITKNLVVFGRRFNDDKLKRSTWLILEENGLFPFKFYSGNDVIEYSSVGDIHDHNTGVYKL